MTEIIATRPISRRAVVTAAVWTAPAIVVISAAPALAASVTAQSASAGVVAVRVTGPNWVSLAANEAPGFRFSSTTNQLVDMSISKTGVAGTLSELFTVYDSVPWSTGSGNTWAAGSVSITSAKTLGITVKPVDKAVGTYTALIYPHGNPNPSGTAVFTVYKESGVFKVRLGA